jgi:hypothetical protein
LHQGHVFRGESDEMLFDNELSQPALDVEQRRRKEGISLWPFRAARGPFAGLSLAG